jgi:hypothetical protein
MSARSIAVLALAAPVGSVLRALLGLGILLAWVGLALPWYRWRASALVDSEAVKHVSQSVDGFGFGPALPFWLVLMLAVSPLALVVALRWGRRAAALLACGSVVLLWLAIGQIVALSSAGVAFVRVAAPIGAYVSAAGSAVLLLAALAIAAGAAPAPIWRALPSLPPYVAPRATARAARRLRAGILDLRSRLRHPPRRAALAALVGVAAVAVATASAWPTGSLGRGRIADVSGNDPGDLAYAGGTLYWTSYPSPLITARAADGRYYAVADVLDERWSQGDGRDVYSRGALYVAVAGHDLFVVSDTRRLLWAASDGSHRILVARPPDRQREELPIKTVPGEPRPLIVPDFTHGPITAAPDGGVYVLGRRTVRLWRDGRLRTVVRGLDTPSDIAVDSRGTLYVADTGNGRVLAVPRGGSARTVVGTETPSGCVHKGLDAPLALDVRRCIGVRSLAVDSRGNLFLAVRGVAMILGVTPRGKVAVVAGTGPRGFAPGDGSAVQARLGDVGPLVVGAHDDLYVTEYDPVARIRRIADPGRLLAEVDR